MVRYSSTLHSATNPARVIDRELPQLQSASMGAEIGQVSIEIEARTDEVKRRDRIVLDWYRQLSPYHRGLIIRKTLSPQYQCIVRERQTTSSTLRTNISMKRKMIEAKARLNLPSMNCQIWDRYYGYSERN